MKAIYFVATIAIHFIMIVTLKLLDSLYFLLGIMLTGIVAGAIFLFSKNARVKELGWGICFGSALSFIVVSAFTMWLSYNFSK